MRRYSWLLMGVALCPLARAEAPRPTLVLDTGGHTASVRTVLFTPDGKQLITVSNDKTARVWNVATGRCMRVIRPHIGPGREGLLDTGALSPDGRVLALSGVEKLRERAGLIHLVDFVHGRIQGVLRGHTNSVGSMAFSPDGKRLASASSDTTARIWNLETGKTEHVLKGHGHRLGGVAFSPDGKRVVTASYDKTAKVWSVESGKCEATLTGHQRDLYCVAWSPDGTTIATGGLDEAIRLWSPDGTQRKLFGDLETAICSLGFTADSRKLLFTPVNGPPYSCCIVDLNSGDAHVCFSEHNNTVLTGAISPDGKLAATAGGDDCDVFLWKTKDGTVVHHLVGKGKRAVSAGWGPDGKTIAWGSAVQVLGPNERGPLERSFRLTNLKFGPAPDKTFERAQTELGGLSLEKTGRYTIAVKLQDQVVSRLRTPGQYNGILGFTLVTGGRAAVGMTFGLGLFDTATGKQVNSFLGHLDIVWAVAPSPDQRYLVTACSDQVVRIWDPRKREPLLSLFVAGEDWVAWTPESYYAASPGGEKLVGWQVDNGLDRIATWYPAAKFRDRFYRPDIIKHVLDAGSLGQKGKPRTDAFGSSL